MARTMQEISAALRKQYPAISDMVNGETVALDAAAYEARLAEWAADQRAEELAADAQAAARLQRTQVRQALALLDAGATLAQTRVILAGVIRVLIAQGAIEADDPEPVDDARMVGR